MTDDTSRCISNFSKNILRAYTQQLKAFIDPQIEEFLSWLAWFREKHQKLLDPKFDFLPDLFPVVAAHRVNEKFQLQPLFLLGKWVFSMRKNSSLTRLHHR